MSLLNKCYVTIYKQDLNSSLSLVCYIRQPNCSLHFSEHIFTFIYKFHKNASHTYRTHYCSLPMEYWVRKKKTEIDVNKHEIRWLVKIFYLLPCNSCFCKGYHINCAQKVSVNLRIVKCQKLNM